MTKILKLLRISLAFLLSLLGKTISRLAFYVYYYLIKHAFAQKIIRNKQYLILPALAIFLITLASSETVFVFQDEPMTAPILLAKISQPQEKLISDGRIAEAKANMDFTIAATDDNSFDILPTALGDSAIVSPDNILDDTPVMRTDIETYTVQSEDNIATIARKFGISVKSILWENKLTANSLIRPGQQLTILPVDGVTHKVKSGENIAKIAKYYNASGEDIIDFNNLADASDLHIGDLLIIPEGQIPAPPAPRRITTPKTSDKTWLVQKNTQFPAPEGNNCHVFVPGQCTWYVGKKRCIPWTGHAKMWIANARRMGYTIGKTPALGAVIALNESWYGHVGYVEDFTETTVTFSEMNHLGPWITSRRTLNLNDKRIVGFIY